MSAVVLQLNQREEWGLTTGKPTYAVKTCDGRVYDVTVRLRITILMPRWTGLKQAGPNTRAEWRRMFGKLTTHENNHVAILRRHFDDDLARSMLNKSEAEAGGIFDAAIASATSETNEYDSDTRHGVTEGVFLDTSITN